ncbi:MAG: hypothetical protein LZF62_290006 [Nitrospira sp.]|nr:MAG: hypothetical protein LZF62_290006 [Nitrospira sp.]
MHGNGSETRHGPVTVVCRPVLVDLAREILHASEESAECSHHGHVGRMKESRQHVHNTSFRRVVRSFTRVRPVRIQRRSRLLVRDLYVNIVCVRPLRQQAPGHSNRRMNVADLTICPALLDKPKTCR